MFARSKGQDLGSAGMTDPDSNRLDDAAALRGHRGKRFSSASLVIVGDSSYDAIMFSGLGRGTIDLRRESGFGNLSVATKRFVDKEGHPGLA